MLKFLLSVILVGCFVISFSQNPSKYGKFNWTFYSPSDFKSAAQIWSVAQNSSGNLFFGNDTEILSFNGKKWELIPVLESSKKDEAYKIVSKSKVSKIFTNKSGTVLVGRFDNFGEIVYSSKGKLSYNPLYSAKNQGDLGQVWNIFELGKSTFFIGENKLFELKRSKLLEVKIPNINSYRCRSSISLNEGILLVLKHKNPNISERKIVYYNARTKEFKTIEKPDYIDKIDFCGSYFYKEYWYIFNTVGDVYRFQLNNGKFEWDRVSRNLFPQLKNLFVNSVKQINKRIYVATEKHGVLIFEPNGNFIRSFDLEDGMDNLNVYDVYLDKENNTWMCLDNGIHFIETSSPLSYFDKSNGILDFINNFDFKDGKVYFAGATDIWETYIEGNKKRFRSMNILNEQAFDLSTYKTKYGNKTIAIGFSGIYDVDLKTKLSTKISGEYAWLTYQNPINQNEIFVGLETGLAKIKLSKTGWEYQEVIPNIDGYVLSITSLGENLIFGAKNKGVYIYNLKTNKHFKVKNHLNKYKNTPYTVERFKDKIAVGMEGGLFLLSEDLKKMLPFHEIDNHFQGGEELQVHRIINQNDEKLWVALHREGMASEFEHGWLQLTENKKWKWVSWPFEQIGYNKDPLVFDILPLSKNEIWFAVGTTIFSFNQSYIQQVQKYFNISIDEIRLNNKTALYNPKFASQLGNISYQSNSIRFYFHANSYVGLKQMKYRYYLENFMDDWSDWSELNFADFKKLNEGSYKIKIQAKNSYGFKSKILTYSFKISPPWYRTFIAFLIYGLSLIALVIIIVRLSLLRVRKQNIRLEAIVKERTSEIAEQNSLLAEQKQEIEIKTKDIVSSIIYAKRIQETILPDDRLAELFKEYFIFYKPKDIVSGDFYWARKKGNLAIFAAIDCTGHGVPGALVSIVANASLLRCVNEHKLTDPALILDKHREIVVKTFASKNQQEVQDGMDMSLCVLDLDTLKMKYAGANNECVIIRNNELIVLKPDKQPIGVYGHSKPFNQLEIQLQIGDLVYQFTDGFIDQFGGEKGKKLKSNAFKSLLLKYSHLTMNEQYKEISAFFESWKGNLEQLDDVCVFGVKIV